MFVTSREGKAWKARARANGFQGKSLRGLSWTKKRRNRSHEKWGLSLGLSALPPWRIGKTKRLLRKKKNSYPILENQSVGNLNPLCKGEWG